MEEVKTTRRKDIEKHRGITLIQ
ncbi:MAG: hypothetical protein EZS28_053703, partial [Streblomastix strix]